MKSIPYPESPRQDTADVGCDANFDQQEAKWAFRNESGSSVNLKNMHNMCSMCNVPWELISINRNTKVVPTWRYVDHVKMPDHDSESSDEILRQNVICFAWNLGEKEKKKTEKIRSCMSHPPADRA